MNMRKLQNVTVSYLVIQHKDVLPDKKFSTFRVHPPIWCEHKYWISCLTGLSKWSAVSCCINSSDIKSRECVVSVIVITSVFWILHLMMMTHSNQDEVEGADFERKASNLDAKRKEESIRALAKTKCMEKSRVWKPPATTWSAEKTTVDDDRRIIKAVKMNPKRRVCKISNNFQKAGVMLWRSTVLRRRRHRITDVHSKMHTSDQHQT